MQTETKDVAREILAQVYDTDKPKLQTDMGNASRFAEEHEHTAAFATGLGWLVWTGQQWKRDVNDVLAVEAAKAVAWSLYHETKSDFDDASDMHAQTTTAYTKAKAASETPAAVLREAEADLKKTKADLHTASKRLEFAKKTQNASKLRNMLELARGEPAIHKPVELFDSDTMLFNTASGIVDLRDGTLYAHNAASYLTKLSSVSYDPEATCPTWLAFLDRIMNGNQEMIAFLQRALGYTLTGSTQEECIFFLYGTGANGKSTFTNIIQALLGEYAQRMPAASLMHKTLDNGIPNDIAKLAGSRGVIASELPSNKRFNEELLKDLSSSDTLTARFMRGEYFDFKSRFKIWIYGNHKPRITGTDNGIWRRLRLVPFEVTIPEAQRDKALGEKLLGELDGIFQWVLDGCLLWQEHGFQTPAAITTATNEYRQSENVLEAFVAECCTLGVNHYAGYKELYAAYVNWTAEAHEFTLKRRAFGNALTELGYKSDNGTGNKAIRRGLGLVFEPKEVKS